MPLNTEDKNWITGEVHRLLIEVLRAPEFAVPTIKADAAAAAGRAQTARDAALRTEALVQALPDCSQAPVDLVAVKAVVREALADLAFTVEAN